MLKIHLLNLSKVVPGIEVNSDIVSLNAQTSKGVYQRLELPHRASGWPPSI